MIYSNLVSCLQSLSGALELETRSQLDQDTAAICQYLQNRVYKIAVFAPFNHGKSTLLNALLGSKTLPIDLIPTTGAAITVGYGKSLLTKITLQDGQEIVSEGVKILQQYAVLDDDRRMKSEVAEVKVFCDHSWLKTGVEFLDLPGTNDREAQNELVKDKLLGADLIIHVLDARKLMTLEERENLTNWLASRGIATVVFVVNFLNLLTEAERKEVQTRLRLIASSFRSQLPAGISNLYCVDALPALRARLKGNSAAAQTTGLTTFETALQQIASQKQGAKVELARVVKLSEQLLQQAKLKQQQIAAAIEGQQQQDNQQIVVKQKAEKLIKQSWQRSLGEFQGWLYLPKLLAAYQPALAIALQQGRFDSWLENFQAEVSVHQQAINKWIIQGCEFFQHQHPQLLAIAFPPPPTIAFPAPSESQVDNSTASNINIPDELNFMLKTKIGAVVLGGASYVLHKANSKTSPAASPKQASKSSQVYIDAAETYLTTASDRLNTLVREYETIGDRYVTFTPPTKPADTANYQLQLIQGVADNLETELARLLDC